MFNKNNAISFSFDPKEKYTLWTGLLGGFFLSLSYFGTDQSQVSRYINAKDQNESRIGLIFNAILKIPFQFLILYIGILLFVFYGFLCIDLLLRVSRWSWDVCCFYLPHHVTYTHISAHETNGRAYAVFS